MDEAFLSVFAPELSRLLLGGGDGLPAAFGPLFGVGGVRYVWDGLNGIAHAATVHAGQEATWQGFPAISATGWRLPLDASSPWPARLALVTAFLLLRGEHTPPLRHAWLTEIDDDEMGLYWVEGCGVEMIHWNMRTGECDQFVAEDEDDQPDDLPTLPDHLKTQPPAVALLLAVWDATRKA